VFFNIALTMSTNFASAWQNPSFYSQDTASFAPITIPSNPSQTITPTEPVEPLKKRSGSTRLNKFVRRLHNMLKSEKDSGVVEWRKGLLVLHSTDKFTKFVLPKYFNTTNFKTFRRQLNYYGFVHVRSFSSTGTATTALWVNQNLSQIGSNDISSVLLLRRVEAEETAKTVEGRRVRKEAAAVTVKDISIENPALLPAFSAGEASDLDDSTSHEQAQPLTINAPMIPSFIRYNDGYGENESISSAPSLANSSINSPRSQVSSTSSTLSSDDAANLLLSFSKSVSCQH